MLRLWNLLIYGEWETSKWETIGTSSLYKGRHYHMPIKNYIVQKNQYGRIRRVRV
jgi:hypothetical protein